LYKQLHIARATFLSRGLLTVISFITFSTGSDEQSAKLTIANTIWDSGVAAAQLLSQFHQSVVGIAVGTKVGGSVVGVAEGAMVGTTVVLG
jgi:hypothetical protein